MKCKQILKNLLEFDKINQSMCNILCVCVCVCICGCVCMVRSVCIKKKLYPDFCSRI